MKRLFLRLLILSLLTSCGTMSTYQKVALPYQYRPLKPNIAISPYFVSPEPATLENVSLASQIRFAKEYVAENSISEELTVAPTAEEAKLVINLSIGEISIIKTEPTNEAQMVAGSIERKYRYIYRFPVKAQFYTTGKELLWEKNYDNVMQHYTELQSETAFKESQTIELEMIKGAYFIYLHKKLTDDFTKLFYLRNLTYEAIIGESGPQERMIIGNQSSIKALELTKAGQYETALPEWQHAIKQYESLINDQVKRKNGTSKVSVREKAIAYYNCAQAYMWLQDYDKAHAMIDSALSLSREYRSDSTNSQINSDRFMFPRLKDEIGFRKNSTKPSR